MNCSACGTQLPQGAANCPQCGATTPYSYSHASIAPNDPTVESSASTDAQQPPPPGMYGSPSYGAASQTSYGSPSYQPLYEPYSVAPLAPPPPSPKRPGKHIGIIVGVVLLVLLLIGGGVFAWFEYSSARNAAAAAQTTATAQATAAAQATATATANFTATGTFTTVSRIIAYVGQDGNNKIYSYTQQEVSYGDVAGPYTTKLTLTLHPDNTATFSGGVSCTCTVAGKSGPLMWSFTGTSAANGSFQGQDSDFHGTGDLAKLHGQGMFQGQGLHGTYSYLLHFDA